MPNLSRRTVLKNMARMSSLAAATPLLTVLAGCCPRDQKVTLNVALHGLFVLNLLDGWVELLTPTIKEHRYKAGSWDFNSVAPLLPGVTHVLRGVRAEKEFPDFDGTTMPVFSRSACNVHIQPAESYCKVILPFPAVFTPLRHCQSTADYQSPYPSEDGCNPVNAVDVCIRSLALCPVLSYVVPDSRRLQLTHTPWYPVVDKETRTANLHLWAEPEERLMPNHADRAYARLSCLIPPLRLHLAVNSTVPLDRDTGVLGFPSEQEQGWSDWAGNGGEGAYPTNCCSMLGRK